MFDGTDGTGATHEGAAAVWSGETPASTWTLNTREDWREVDRTLRGIARQRAALDADEARWLREAERIEVWKPLGMVNMMDYMERALGYAPRTAQKRLQVARALEALPALTDALAAGELSFSGVRELVRVATPTTEEEWLQHVGGMNLRQIEEAVAGRRPGDRPTDAADDGAREHVITLRVTASAYAVWRQGRLQIDEEHDHRLDDSELVEAVFARPRDRHDDDRTDADTDGVGRDSEISGRAKFQIALSVCPRCERGWQEGAGCRVPIDAATVARARCDAQHLGSLNGAGPERAHQDVPPSIVRFVWRRDHGRCQTPGCRSARGLELHHIQHREHGGAHDPWNITLRCSACHIAHHRGLLEITGVAPDHIVTTRTHAQPRELDPRRVAASGASAHREDQSTQVANPGVHVDALHPRDGSTQIINPGVHVDALHPRDGSRQLARRRREEGSADNADVRARGRYDEVVARAQARDALITSGWKPAVARVAIDEACAHLGTRVTLEVLVREALRRCPV